MVHEQLCRVVFSGGFQSISELRLCDVVRELACTNATQDNLCQMVDYVSSKYSRKDTFCLHSSEKAQAAEEELKERCQVERAPS